MIIIYDFGYELPMEQKYNLIKKVGFDGVTLWWSDDFGRSDYRNAPPLARKAGLYIENIHAPFNGINNIWLDNLAGDTLTEYFLCCVDDCDKYDIPTMILHLSGGENPPPICEIGLNRIKKIIDKADKLNINIAFENLRKSEYLEYVFNNIESPHAGFCYDSGHHNCRNPNEDLLSKYGSRLMALHLHDNDGTDDQHLLPFDGTIDWKSTIGDISQTGYTGAMSLEVANVGYEDLSPESFLQLAFDRAKLLVNLK